PGWQPSLAAQTTAVPDSQAPLLQRSPLVQASPSVHGVPSASGAFTQAPLDRSHTPAAWHWSPPPHTTGAPLQAPARQTSPLVQASPSSQLTPLSIGSCWQPFAPQESAVHGFWSSQETPHAPQAPAALSDCSQPFAGSWSQSANADLQRVEMRSRGGWL